MRNMRQLFSLYFNAFIQKIRLKEPALDYPLLKKLLKNTRELFRLKAHPVLAQSL
jgi:hypothetical protein